MEKNKEGDIYPLLEVLNKDTVCAPYFLSPTFLIALTSEGETLFQDESKPDEAYILDDSGSFNVVMFVKGNEITFFKPDSPIYCNA